MLSHYYICSFRRGSTLVDGRETADAQRGASKGVQPLVDSRLRTRPTGNAEHRRTPRIGWHYERRTGGGGPRKLVTFAERRSRRRRVHNDPMASTGRLSSEPLASADRPQQSGRIVVGVDASQGSLNALLWALGEARARKIPVHAVLAWQYRPSWTDPGLGSMFPWAIGPATVCLETSSLTQLLQ